MRITSAGTLVLLMLLMACGGSKPGAEVDLAAVPGVDSRMQAATAAEVPPDTTGSRTEVEVAAAPQTQGEAAPVTAPEAAPETTPVTTPQVPPDLAAPVAEADLGRDAEGERRAQVETTSEEPPEVQPEAQPEALPEAQPEGYLQAPGEVLPTTIAVGAFSERPGYRIGIGDKLWIKFFYYPGYNLEVTVRPDGVITVPSLGEVKAEGMMPAALQEMIRAHYAQFLLEPEVSVIVQFSASQIVFVLGEVRNPGSVEYSRSRTVLEALSEAGGVNVQAKLNSLVLIRKGPTGEFEGIKLNLEDILDSRADNVALMPRDVIYVPMSAIAKVDLFVDQFFAQISPVLLFYLNGSEIFNPEGRFYIGH